MRRVFVAQNALEWRAQRKTRAPPNFGGAVPRLIVSDATSSGTWDDYLLEAEATVAEGYVHGGSFQASIDAVVAGFGTT